MRTILLVWFIMMSILSCNAQERIRLVSGKVLEGAKFYKEHPHHVTYVKNQTLHDLEKAKIGTIETDSSIIQFDENGVRKEFKRQGVDRGNEPFFEPRKAEREDSSSQEPASDPVDDSRKEQTADTSRHIQPAGGQAENPSNLDDDDGSSLPPPSIVLKYAGMTVGGILTLLFLIAISA